MPETWGASDPEVGQGDWGANDPEIGSGIQDVRPKSFLLNRASIPGSIIGGASDFLQGIGAGGVIRPAVNSIDFIRKLIGYDPLSNRPAVKDAMTAPDSWPGNTGDIAGTALDFLAPEVAGLGKVRTAITASSGASIPTKIASVLGRAGLEAGTNAAVTAAQTGNSKAAINAALVSGVLGGLGAAAEQPLINRATKMEAAAVKPSVSVATSVEAPPGEGAEQLAKNIFKYDLGGSLKDTAAKTLSAIKDRGDQLRSLLASQPTTYNLNDAIDQTEQDLLGTAEARAKNATFVPEIQNALAKFRKDAALIQPEVATQPPFFTMSGQRWGPTQVITPAGEVDLLSANSFKQSVGHVGDFAYGHPARDAEGLAIVGNRLYTNLKNGIQDKAGTAGPAIARVNKELSELIPISRAVIRRVPIDYRQNMISLGTMLSGLPALATGNPNELMLPLAYYASKSPRMANVLQKAATATPGLSGKLASAAISENTE